MRETWRRGREGWQALPSEARARWAKTLVFGWLLCAALAVALALGGKRANAHGMEAWDRETLEALVAADPISFQTAVWFEAWGSSAVLIPVTLVAAIVAARARRALAALTIAAAYLLHDPLVLLIGWLWPRARPELVAGGIASPPLHSFPSGHTVQAIAVYGLLAWIWVRRAHGGERAFATVLVLAVAGIVGLARLRMGTHWPSDIAGGAIMGLAWLIVCIVALRPEDPASTSPGG